MAGEYREGNWGKDSPATGLEFRVDSRCAS